MFWSPVWYIYGKYPKGLRGRPTKISIYLWGAVRRETGELVLKVFDKISEKNVGETRSVPAKRDQVLPLVEKQVRRGSTVMSDILRACKTSIKKMGYNWEGLNHFQKDPTVSPAERRYVVCSLWDPPPRVQRWGTCIAS